MCSDKRAGRGTAVQAPVKGQKGAAGTQREYSEAANAQEAEGDPLSCRGRPQAADVDVLVDKQADGQPKATCMEPPAEGSCWHAEGTLACSALPASLVAVVKRYAASTGCLRHAMQQGPAPSCHALHA